MNDIRDMFPRRTRSGHPRSAPCSAVAMVLGLTALIIS